MYATKDERPGGCKDRAIDEAGGGKMNCDRCNTKMHEYKFKQVDGENKAVYKCPKCGRQTLKKEAR